MMGVGVIIGPGILVMSGTVAARYAGPAIAISYVLAFAVCLAVGLCYGELSSMMPSAGGAYTFITRGLGRRVGWLAGWCLLLQYLLAGSIIAVGWSAYAANLVRLLGWTVAPDWSGNPFQWTPGQGVSRTEAILNMPAVLIVASQTGLLLLGAKQSFRINTAIVAIKMVIIVGFIATGLGNFDSANWTPFVPPNTGAWGAFGVSGILKAAALVFVAYLGFDVLATTAQEARNPGRTVPRAIILTLVVCTVLYVMASLALTGLVHYTNLDVGNPLDVALRAGATTHHWMMIVVDAGITIGLTAGVFSLLYAQARVMYAMATDEMLPGWLASISSRGVPVLGIVAAGLLTAVLAGSLPVAFLTELIAACTLLVFALVCATLLILRRTAPQARRAFVVPLVPLVPATGCLACCGLLAGLSPATWIRFVVWLAVGFAIYAFRTWTVTRAGDGAAEAVVADRQDAGM